MMEISVAFCRDFSGPQWELPTEGARLLIAWPELTTADNAGVPAVVQALLCHSMTSGHDVVWLSGEELPDRDARALKPSLREGPGWAWRRLTGRPHEVRLCRSGDLPRVRQLFNAPGFCWDQRGQIAMLVPPAAPFAPERVELLAAIGTQRLMALEPLYAQGAACILLPGVDGCVAGLYAPDADAVDSFADRLGACAAACGIQLKEVGEPELPGGTIQPSD